MGLVNVLWSGVSILVILTGSIIMFNEQLSTYDKIGIVFIIVGIFLVTFEDDMHPHEKFLSQI
jgi:multidrug transporter EmrE-like cation transporter